MYFAVIELSNLVLFKETTLINKDNEFIFGIFTTIFGTSFGLLHRAEQKINRKNGIRIKAKTHLLEACRFAHLELVRGNLSHEELKGLSKSALERLQNILADDIGFFSAGFIKNYVEAIFTIKRIGFIRTALETGQVAEDLKEYISKNQYQ
jgi:hypothetical protein